jgi:hypothetical protein
VAQLHAVLLARPETLLAIEHREASVRDTPGFTHVLLVGQRGGPSGARLLGIREAQELLYGDRERGGGGGGAQRGLLCPIYDEKVAHTRRPQSQAAASSARRRSSRVQVAASVPLHNAGVPRPVQALQLCQRHPAHGAHLAALQAKGLQGGGRKGESFRLWRDVNHMVPWGCQITH